MQRPEDDQHELNQGKFHDLFKSDQINEQEQQLEENQEDKSQILNLNNEYVAVEPDNQGEDQDDSNLDKENNDNIVKQEYDYLNYLNDKDSSNVEQQDSEQESEQESDVNDQYDSDNSNNNVFEISGSLVFGSPVNIDDKPSKLENGIEIDNYLGNDEFSVSESEKSDRNIEARLALMQMMSQQEDIEYLRQKVSRIEVLVWWSLQLLIVLSLFLMVCHFLLMLTSNANNRFKLLYYKPKQTTKPSDCSEKRPLIDV